VVLVLLGSVAVVIGRWGGGAIAPPPPAVREFAPPKARILDGTMFAGRYEVSRVLDLETGTVDFLNIPQLDAVDMISISPWRDGDGQQQMVGRWRGDRRTPQFGLGGPLGMLRLSFPEGRILGRIAFDPIPISPPCWLPDDSDRVVFAAGDGQLYL